LNFSPIEKLRQALAKLLQQIHKTFYSACLYISINLSSKTKLSMKNLSIISTAGFIILLAAVTISLVS
jgi:hypothetical protein